MIKFPFTDESPGFSIPLYGSRQETGPDTLFPSLNSTRNQTRGVDIDGNEDFIELLWNELYNFNQFWERLVSILVPCEITLLALGLVGNVLAFSTLLYSNRMSTPSFLYHRALVAADLIFCTNFFINLLNDRLSSVDCKQGIFRYRSAAFYSAIINPCVNSICSYVLSYATVCVTLDRFLALSSYCSYQKWNQRRVAVSVITVSIFLSVTVHSWTVFVQNTVIEHRLDRDANDTLIWQPCWNERVVYHWVKRNHFGPVYQTAYNVKGIYNAVFRFAYSVFLIVLTLGIFSSLARRARRKKRLARGCGGGRRLLHIPHAASRAIRRHERCEKALLFLTISVLILAFFQVVAGEGRRIMQLTYPADEVIRRKVDNPTLPVDERLGNFRRVLYIHQSSRALANLFTVIERSAICFLYVAANKLFRGEVALFLGAVFIHGKNREEFRKRFDSDARYLRSTTVKSRTTGL